jgi:phytoene dehydrogenase-like protein
MVLHEIEKLGVKVLTGCEPKAITTKENEVGERVFTGFELADGETLESDLVRSSFGRSHGPLELTLFLDRSSMASGSRLVTSSLPQPA